MEVLGLLSAASVPTQGPLPSSDGATAVEFAAVLDGLDLRSAVAVEDAADPAQGDEEADESEEAEQAEFNVIVAGPTVPAPAPLPLPTTLSDASPPSDNSTEPLVADMDAALAQSRSDAPQLARLTTENVVVDSAETDITPAAVDLPDTPADEKSHDRLRPEPAGQRASVAIASGMIPSSPQAAPPLISAASKPEAPGAIRERQSLEPPNRLELPDLMNFTVTAHESRVGTLAPDSHVTTRAQLAPDARHVLQQIGDKLSDGPDGMVEIALSPEELGKVRLVIAPGEKPTVTVHADRPETYDLLRRNAEALDKELRSAGIFGADISFSGGNDRPRNRNQAFLAASRSSGPRDNIMNFTEHTAPARARSVVDGQIDIRI